MTPPTVGRGWVMTVCVAKLIDAKSAIPEQHR
jgi:hypothetical protein